MMKDFIIKFHALKVKLLLTHPVYGANLLTFFLLKSSPLFESTRDNLHSLLTATLFHFLNPTVCVQLPIFIELNDCFETLLVFFHSNMRKSPKLRILLCQNRNDNFYCKLTSFLAADTKENRFFIISRPKI